MKKKMLLTMLGLTCAMGQAYSFSCAYLNVEVINATSNTCTLVNQNLKHGAFDFFTTAPTYLPPNTGGQIILGQTFYGPELDLTYSCGDDTEITFTSQQGYCGFSAGDVSGVIVNAKNMTAESQITTGSWWWAQPGTINWRLR